MAKSSARWTNCARAACSIRRTAPNGIDRPSSATTKTARSSKATASLPTSPPTSLTIATSSSAIFGKLINVWGADHHGYVPRLKAAMRGLGYDPNVLQVVLVQMVQLTRGGEPVRMGKRTGEFVALEEVLGGSGAGRGAFFFPDAQIGQPSGLRLGSCQKTVERESGFLCPIRPCPGRQHFRASDEKRRTARRPSCRSGASDWNSPKSWS